MKFQHKLFWGLTALFIASSSALDGFSQETLPTPVYKFLCDSSELSNTGTVGGSAEIHPPSANAASVTNDPERKTDVLVFPASETKLGSWMEFPESADKLRLNQSGQEMTLSVWIRWNGPLPGINRQCIVTTMGSAQKEGWSLSIGTSGRLVFNWQLPSGTGGERMPVESIEVGQWTHIALVWRNDSKQGLAFYINGVPVASEGGPGGGPLVAGNDPIRFGAFTNGTNGYAPLNAAVSDISLYDIALDEIAVPALAVPK